MRIQDLDAADAIAEIERVTIEHPDQRYTPDPINGTCAYTPDANNPLGCLIGQALHRLGVPWNELTGKGYATSLPFRTITREEQNMLLEMQRLQDQQRPWGACWTG